MKIRNSKLKIRSKFETPGSRSGAMLRLAAVILCGFCLAESGAGEKGAGFKKIFNGKDLKGWDGDPTLWSVKEGTIVGQTTAQNPIKHNTFLIWTNSEVGDFEFRCQYRITA